MKPDAYPKDNKKPGQIFKQGTGSQPLAFLLDQIFKSSTPMVLPKSLFFRSTFCPPRLPTSSVQPCSSSHGHQQRTLPQTLQAASGLFRGPPIACCPHENFTHVHVGTSQKIYFFCVSEGFHSSASPDILKMPLPANPSSANTFASVSRDGEEV